MNILVTGGAGFIGSHVVDALIAAGHRVSIVDNLCKTGGGCVENVNPDTHRFHEIDIRDDRLASVFEKEKPEIVCHLAAQSSLSISTREPDYDADVNVMGTLKLLAHCVQHSVRKVIFASSSAIYGIIEQMPIHEDTPKSPPETPYGVAKLAVEGYLHVWRQIFGLDFTIFRFGNVYGPRQNPNMENGVIAIFADAILGERSVRIDGDGEQSKDYVYVGDIARAHVLALEHGGGEAYCLGTRRATSVNWLYERLAELIGHGTDVRHAPQRVGDVLWFSFDCSKAKRDLGWEPKVDLETGLKLTVEHYRRNREG